MTHIEGDGVIEDIYYLLWRKDSPFNEKLNLRIPETIIFRRGRPMAWYFTNNEGTVLRKKQTSLTYPDIVKKFTKNATEGEIVGYFINIDDEKKLARLLDKSQFRGLESQDNKGDADEIPSHKVEYYSLKDFTSTFADYKTFGNKTGILQQFIHPYGSNNELIQAIWSPRVCVFTKRVNLRRLNETRFDVYERALTFDGPDFYSKNVPLRGGYIPGKLRATCDNIIQHIAYISYEKISIKRIVGYFKVDRNENVWFLWTSSIRIKETSKTHKKMSQYIDKPLCLEPCMRTDENIRHIKSNFASKPVSLQMNEQCIICAKISDRLSMIPVAYKLLLGNEEILKRSEQNSDTKIRIYSSRQEGKAGETQPISVRKGAIGVPVFLKKLHPGLTFKEFLALREKDHFLMTKTEVCEECYLLVSKEYEGGFPYKLTEPKKRPETTGGMRNTQSFNTSQPEITRQEQGNATNDELDDSNEEPNSNEQRIPLPSNSKYPPIELYEHGSKSTKSAKPSDRFYFASVNTSTTNKTAKSHRFPDSMDGAAWIQTAKKLAKLDIKSSESHLEETKMSSTHNFDQSSLKRDVLKAFGVVDSTDSNIKVRSAQSAKGIKVVKDIQKVDNEYFTTMKPSRPKTTSETNLLKGGRLKKLKNEHQPTPSKYKLSEDSDLFADSSENTSQIEELLINKSIRRQDNRLAWNVSEKDEYFPQEVMNAKKRIMENRLQDHLDQDMVLLMANSHSARPGTTPSMDKPLAPSTTKSMRTPTEREARLQQIFEETEFEMAGKKNTGRSQKVRFKKEKTLNENTIIKELEDQVETLIQQYVGDTMDY